MDKSVQLFRQRRRKRLSSRMDEEGWVTTKSGHKIHINENGYIDIGSPFTRGGMGKPKGKKIPKSCDGKKRIEPPYRFAKDTAEAMGKIIAGRAEKDCVFGGFFKVEVQKTKSTERHMFFNPWTQEYFPVVMMGTGDESNYKNEYIRQMKSIPVSSTVAKLFLNASRMDSARYDAPGEESESPNVGNNHAGGSHSKSGGGHGNTRLPYGIAKGLGLDTTGMEPREVWDMLSGKYGISPDDCYDKLEKGEKLEAKKLVKTPKEKVKTLTAYNPYMMGKTEYRELSAEKGRAKKGEPTWHISGTFDYEAYDGTKRTYRRGIQSFYTKEELLDYLKTHGVEEITIDGETINPQDTELPAYVGGTNKAKFKKVSIKKAADGFEIVAEYLDGSKHKFGVSDSVKKAKDFIESRFSVDRDKISISKKVLAADKERNSWSTADDGTHFTDDGKEIGKLEIEPGREGKFKVHGVDTDEKYYEREFDDAEKAVAFLKDKGITKAKFGDYDIDPTTYKVPKVILETRSGRKFTRLMIERDGDDAIKLYGVGADGRKHSMAYKGYWDPMSDFEDSLSRYGLSLSDDRIEMSDEVKYFVDLKKEEERKKAEETAEKEKLMELRRTKIAESKEKRKAAKEAALANPEYKSYDSRPYKDFKISVDSDDAVRVYATDAFGVTHSISSRAYTPDNEESIDDAIDYLKSAFSKYIPEGATIMDTKDENDYGTYKDDFGIEQKLDRAPEIMDTYGEVPGKGVNLHYGSGGFKVVEFDTMEEAVDFVRSIGSNEYVRNNKRFLFEPHFTPHVRPKIRHAKIIKRGETYSLVGDSDERGSDYTFVSGSKEDCEKYATDNNVKAGKIKYVIPVPNDYVKRTCTAKSLRRFDATRRKRIEGTDVGQRSEEDQVKLTAMVKGLFDKGAYCMRRSPERLEDIFDTHFKNLLETGTSGGCANPLARRELEERVFGIPEEYGSVSAEEREKYGYLWSDEILKKPGNTTAKWYGAMNIVFKKDRVAERATYGFGDSLDCHIPTVGYAGQNPTIEGLTGMGNYAIDTIMETYEKYESGKISFTQCISQISKECQDEYIEVQYHDMLTLEDVDQLQFRGTSGLDSAFSGISKDKAQKMLEKFQEWGTKIVYSDNGHWVDGTDYIKNKYGI